MPTFGVNVVVIRDEKVLLTLRSDLPVWCLPGGAIEAGETLVEAAVREALEETGAEIEILGIVGVYSRPNWRDSGNHEVVFVGRQIGGELVPLDGEAVEVSYFSLTELPKELLWWHRERIVDAMQGEVVARNQDAQWPRPFADIEYEEGKRLVAEEKLPVQQLVAHFCEKPAESASYLELGDLSE